MTVTRKVDTETRELTIVCPVGDLGERSDRMDDILRSALDWTKDDIAVSVLTTVDEIKKTGLRGRRVIFAVCLSEAGINMEYYRMLEYFRQFPDCLDGSVGGIIVDGSGELYTKALARRLAFSANLAGCTFPGKPLVEATGSLTNFHVLSGVMHRNTIDVYRDQVLKLICKVLHFELPGTSAGTDPIKLLAVHASSQSTSNSLLLWQKIRGSLGDRADIKEISLRNGSMLDCRGCGYESCLHFGEQGGCFYGGIMVDQVYPAILECDALVMICPNYNDAVSANLTAFINRLTALFHTHDFSKKRIYALVVSGYSGGDIVAEQIIGAINFNKNFILPARFAMVETANDPGSISRIDGIDEEAARFADHMW